MDLYHVYMYFKESILDHEKESGSKEREKLTGVDCVRQYLLDTWWLGELIQVQLIRKVDAGSAYSKMKPILPIPKATGNTA